MCTQELPSLVLEFGQVHACANARQCNRSTLAKLILKICVNDDSLALFNQPDQRS